MCRWSLRWSLTVLAAVVPAVAAAQRLPIESYSTVNGLSNNWVNRIVADSRGFLWFCTREGLSRFDGSGFTNYGVDDGLPSPIVYNLLETREGVYWVATSRGLARFNQAGSSGKQFTTILPSPDPRSHDVRAIFQDRAGHVWVGTLWGLYRVQPGGAAVERLALPAVEPEVLAIAEDRTGTLWAGASIGLYRIARERVDYLTTRDGLPGDFISALATDGRGRIWIGTRMGGIAIMEIDPKTGRASVGRRYGVHDGLPSVWVNDLLVRPDGTIWAAMTNGLAELEPAGDGYRIRTFNGANGLPAAGLTAVGEDRHQRLWIGTEVGAANLGRLEFAIFGPADGVRGSSTLLETPDGEVLVVDDGGAGTRIVRLDGGPRVAAELPVSRAPLTWAHNQGFLIDREGDWWIGSRKGVHRYRVDTIEGLGRATPIATYDRSTGLANDVVLRLFEDSRGDMWVATAGEGRPEGLSRWRRATNSWEHWNDADGLPLGSAAVLRRGAAAPPAFFVTSLAEDRAGNVWLGFNGVGGLARYRHGEWTRYRAAEGVPVGTIRGLLIDAQGRLWAASAGGGLAVASMPSADQPVFTTYTTARGLSSNSVTAIVEGADGQIYAGTGRGLERIDPATGRVTTIAAGGGFPLGFMHAAIRSRTGAFWFSFNSGVVRYRPIERSAAALPSTLITGVDVSGERRSVSALGQPDLQPFDLDAGRTLNVEFLAPGADRAARLRYQMKLDGAGGEWGPPFDHRAVTFANLSPGSYRFAVRAIDADGVAGAEAGFRFTVLAPVWRRWWFLTLMVAAVAAVAHALYRRRMARLLEVARMRARIATDLHDDIGANLTRIAVLSEVARQQPDAVANGRKLDSQLASIATVARESMTAMSDIVWAISPERDNADELVQKMREYAGEICPDIALTFNGPDGARASRLGPDARREVYLIFKEAMNNVARHAASTAVDVTLRIDAGSLVLEIRDNGTGFESGAANDGNGLVSMRRRAERLGGRLTVTSAPGRGTTVQLLTHLFR